MSSALIWRQLHLKLFRNRLAKLLKVQCGVKIQLYFFNGPLRQIARKCNIYRLAVCERTFYDVGRWLLYFVTVLVAQFDDSLVV